MYEVLANTHRGVHGWESQGHYISIRDAVTAADRIWNVNVPSCVQKRVAMVGYSKNVIVYQPHSGIDRTEQEEV